MPGRARPPQPRTGVGGAPSRREQGPVRRQLARRPTRRSTMEAERATKFVHELLELLVKQKGSDLFITAGFPPAIKVDGKIAPVSKTMLTPQHTIELVRSVMNDK